MISSCNHACIYRYNVRNGGPAPESITDAIFHETKKISKIYSCESFPEIDLDTVGRIVVAKGSAGEGSTNASSFR